MQDGQEKNKSEEYDLEIKNKKKAGRYDLIFGLIIFLIALSMLTSVLMPVSKNKLISFIAVLGKWQICVVMPVALCITILAALGVGLSVRGIDILTNIKPEKFYIQAQEERESKRRSQSEKKLDEQEK